MPSTRLRPVVVIVAGYVLGAALYARLPAEIPPSWRVSGHNVLWLGRAMVAFLLPTAAAVTLGLLRTLSTRDLPERDKLPQASIVCDAILLRFVLFLMAMHATVLAGSAGLLWGRDWAARIISVFLGAALIGIGNLLPRTRPNRAIGIRTSRTLGDRNVWMRTHRMAGYMVVTLGLLILLGAIAVPAPLGPQMGRLIEPAALLGIPALVLYSRRVVGD